MLSHHIPTYATLSCNFLNSHFQDLVPGGVEGLFDGLGLPLVGVSVVRDQLDLHVRVTG